MKGSLLSVNPNSRLHDLTHQIPPQDLKYTAYFLKGAISYFPPKTLHVVVVDPGVGSKRTILYVEVGDQCLLVPDNGCWTSLISPLESPTRVIQLTNQDYWRKEVSYTFHGRDIFAPVAGHLSLSVEPDNLGQVVTEWVELDLPMATITDSELRGEVVFVDEFGNLLTNIPAEQYLAWANQNVEIKIGTFHVKKRVRTYSEASVGEVVALVSSLNTFEVSVNQGSAAKRLGLSTGSSVVIRILQ